MADLIERDRTIYKLEAFRESCIANLLRMSFEDITDVVKDIPAVNRWIPCSERLPEQEDQYLVTTASGKVCIWSFYFALASKRPYFSGDEKVIAWMPKPDAYEPEKE